jgi:phosphatidylglycerophosphatase A
VSGRSGDALRMLLISGGGLGRARVASGTFGTLGGVALAVAVQLAFSGPLLAAALGALALGLLWAGCSMTAFVARASLGEDPGVFVLDEIVGYLLALALFVAVAGDPGWLVHAVAFVAFRFFDVVKVFPANRLEQIAGAPGIMLDDVAAGLYTGLVLVALHLLELFA